MADKPQLQIFQLFIFGFRFCWQNRMVLIKAAGLPLILGLFPLAIVIYLSVPTLAELGELNSAMMQGNTLPAAGDLERLEALWGELTVWLLALLAVVTLAGAPFFMLCQRAVLLGPDRIDDGNFVLGRIERRYIGALLLFLLLGNLPGLFLFLLPDSLFANGGDDGSGLLAILTMFSILLGLWLLIRLMVILPGYSIGLPLTLKEGWALGKGQGMVLLAASFLTGAPLVLISSQLIALIGLQGFSMLSTDAGRGAFLAILVLVQHFMVYGVLSIVMAKAFQELAGLPEEGIEA